MPWTLNISLFDFGGWYSRGLPVLAGSIFSPPDSGTPIDTATSSAPALLTLAFPSSAVPPSGAAAVLVTDPGTTGDLLRSGIVNPLPASPATGTVLTSPTAPISASTLSAAAAGFPLPPPTAIPFGYRWLCGVLTGGTWIPLVFTAGPLTTTFGSGTLTLTAPVSLAVRVFFFSVRTVTLTLTATVTLAPSHDPAIPSRVLSIGPSAPPSLLGGPSASSVLLSLIVSVVVAGMLEPAINEAIVSSARGLMRGMGFVPTATAVFCARGVTVRPTGALLQVALADLLGPAVVPVTGVLSVAISPRPAAGVFRTYIVTVTDTATGTPVPMASVTLHNYDQNGASSSTTATTDQAGQVRLNVNLNTRTVIKQPYVDGRERDTVIIKPLLIVQHVGFNSVRISLL
jgi:hypothetical protein